MFSCTYFHHFILIITIILLFLLSLFLISHLVIFSATASEISFGPVSEGCECTTPMTLKNISSVPIELVLNLTNYPYFSPIIRPSGALFLFNFCMNVQYLHF